MRKKFLVLLVPLFIVLFLYTIKNDYYIKPLIARVLQFDEQDATILAIKKVNSAVVNITVLENQSGVKTIKGAGTGFIISSDGYVITNRHVVEAADEKLSQFKVLQSSGISSYAQLIGKDPLNDLAILKISANKLPFVELGDSDKLELGTSVIAIGNSLGLYQNSVTKGIVSGLNRSIVASDQTGNAENLGNVIQTDAEINLGNSGGPLIDLNGKVVGVNVAVDTSGSAIGFAIPINDAKTVINNVRKLGRIARPRLGIKYVMINPTIEVEKGLIRSDGAYIDNPSDGSQAITPGSPADIAGLKPGDIIFDVNGTRINEKNSLLSVTQKYKPGDKITLKVQRDKNVITLIVTLDEFK